MRRVRRTYVFAHVSKLKRFADTYPLDTCPIRSVGHVLTYWMERIHVCRSVLHGT